MSLIRFYAFKTQLITKYEFYTNVCCLLYDMKTFKFILNDLKFLFTH